MRRLSFFARSHRRDAARRIIVGLIAAGAVALLASSAALAVLTAAAPKLKFHRVDIPLSAKVNGSSVKVLENPGQLALSPNASTLVFSDYETGVWAVNTSHPGRALVPLTFDGGALAADHTAGVAYSPNGRYLYVGTYTTGLMIFRAEPNPVNDRYLGNVADPHALLDDEEQITVAPSGKTLYVAEDAGVAVIDLTHGGSTGSVKKVLSVPAAGGSGANSVAVSPNGKVLYVAGYDSSGIAIVDDHNGTYTDAGLMAKTAGPSEDEVYGITLSPDGRTLYLPYFDYYDNDYPNEVITVALHPGGTRGTVVSKATSALDAEYYGLAVGPLGREVYGVRFTATEKGSPPKGAYELMRASVPGAVQRVSVSGKDAAGHRLTAKVKAVAGAVISYQWLAGGKPIKGATHKSLTLSNSLVGKRVRVEVTGTAPAYSQAPVISRALASSS